MSSVQRHRTLKDIANILLHARAARKVVGSLNETGILVDEFHRPLGITAGREELSTVEWGVAIKDPTQLKTAGKEIGRDALGVVSIVAAAALSSYMTKNRGEND